MFHCEATNEVFTDYEQFFERTILCNSLVWSCSVTGKSGLTYEEAVDSEQKAKKRISKRVQWEKVHLKETKEIGRRRGANAWKPQWTILTNAT